ncbi:MAG: amidohydrolase family protein [Actinomycetota bacterium]|nr:amidohydrolase family protein [Actinomycetota bacterium]
MARERDQPVIYHGRHVVTLDPGHGPLLDRAGVLVRDGLVLEIGPVDALRRRHPGAREVGGTDRVVVPGLVDAHQHGRALTTSAHGIDDQPLETWLLDQRDRPQPDPFLAARIAGIRLLLSGVTTAAHPHIAPQTSDFADHTVATARGLASAGLRVSFGIDVKDRGSFTYDDDAELLSALPRAAAVAIAGAPNATAPRIDQLDALFQYLEDALDGSLVDVAVAPRGPQWCSPDALAWVAERARRGSHVHVHCAETRAQYGYFALRGSSPVRHLHAAGLLGPNVTLAHAVWLDAHDVRLIAETGAQLSHNPSSNLRLGSGIAPVAHLRRHGVQPALGSDSTGTTSDSIDLFAEARLARHLETLTRAPGDPGTLDEDSPLARLGEFMRAGRSATGRTEIVGRLTVGGPADLVLLDWDRVTAGTVPAVVESEPAWVIGARAGAEHVTDVVVAGEPLVAEGRYLLADLVELETELTEQIVALARPSERSSLAGALRPYVAARTAELAASAVGPFVSNAS